MWPGSVVTNTSGPYSNYGYYDWPDSDAEPKPTWQEVRRKQARDFAARFVWELKQLLKEIRAGIIFIPAEPIVEVPCNARGQTTKDLRWKMKQWKQEHR